jgi:DNA-binding response OmpR family regulator
MPRILLVDDEESILKSLCVLLQSEGHETFACKDPSKAAELIQTENIDLLITDIRMTPIDGIELIKLARQKKPNIPVIIVSAYTSEKTQEEGFNAGCSIYLRKPFKINDVIAALHKVFGPKS